MARKRFTPEQIIGMLREAEVRLSQEEKGQRHLSQPWNHGADLVPLAQGLWWYEGLPGQAS
jgi:hypothetical protein